jgi:hypothetical protein
MLWHGGIPRSLIPIAWAQFTKASAIEDPLLKVPPTRRGNRTRARFPSRSGGNLQEGGNYKTSPTRLVLKDTDAWVRSVRWYRGVSRYCDSTTKSQVSCRSSPTKGCADALATDRIGSAVQQEPLWGLILRWLQRL